MSYSYRGPNLGFRIEQRGDVAVLVYDPQGGCRPASDEEVALWNQLQTQGAYGPNGDSYAAAGGDLADAIRSLVSEGRFDLRDSPKSLVANIQRILGEYEERIAPFATHVPISTEERHG